MAIDPGSTPLPMRLLIVKTSSMGDVVHALPMVADAHRWARDRGIALEVDWLVEPAFAALPALHPGVSQVHRLAWRRWRRALGRRQTWRDMGTLLEALRGRRYDLIVDAQGLLKSVVWARLAHGPVAGYDRHSIREPLASLLVQRPQSVSRHWHAVRRCRALMAAALDDVAHRAPHDAAVGGAPRAPVAAPPTGAPDDGPADFGLSSLEPLMAPELNSPYAVLIPNASRPEKHWPEADWQAVGRRCAEQGWRPVVLWGSRSEEAMAHRIARGCDGWVPPFLTVEEAARLLAGAQRVVGLDTGFSHVAAALGRPVVGIYCDHEPGLTGITGPGPGASLGGKGQCPALSDVLRVLDGLTPPPAA